jgi:hypothetical protein
MMAGRDRSTFERARYLFGRRQFRAARKACTQAANEDPNDPRPTALRARIDAMVGDRSPSDARGVFAELIGQHPDDVYLRTGAAVLMAQDGERSGAITALRGLVVDHPEDPLALQTLAIMLSAEQTTRSEGWSRLKALVAIEPLPWPAQAALAYRIGRQVEPGKAGEVLRGIGFVDKAAIRTTAMHKIGFQLVAIPAAIGLFLCFVHPNAFGFGLLSIATVWAMWCAYSVSVIGSWRGVRRLLLIIPFLWFFAAIAVSIHGGERWTGYLAAGVLVAFGLAVRGRESSKRLKKRPNPSAEVGVASDGAAAQAARPARPLAIVLVLAIVFAAIAAIPPSKSTAQPGVEVTKDGLITTVGTLSGAPGLALGSPLGQVIDRFGQTTLVSTVLCGSSGCHLGFSAFCSDSNPCFGPAISNKEAGTTYLFEAAETAPLPAANQSPPSTALIDGYIQNFAAGTSYKDALGQVLEYLPHDARVGSLGVDHQGGVCGLLKITSATLGRRFAGNYVGDPDGVVEIEFTSRSLSSGNTTFSAKDVESAMLSTIPLSARSECLSFGETLVPSGNGHQQEVIQGS